MKFQAFNEISAFQACFLSFTQLILIWKKKKKKKPKCNNINEQIGLYDDKGRYEGLHQVDCRRDHEWNQHKHWNDRRHQSYRKKQLKEEIDILREENDHLKSKLISMQKNSETLQKVANQALEKSNQNEQYSRKNNIKILNIKEEVGEDETTLLRSVCALLDQQNIALSPQQVVAIHRIPGKSDSPKPVLMKVINNSIKTTIMKKRKTMKSSGHRLVDDVTRLNTALITRLNEHSNIDSA